MFPDLLKRIACLFQGAQVPYMVFGGQAVLVYGDVRLTEDVDVSVALAPDQAGAFLEFLPGAGFEILVDDPGTFLRETFVLPVLDTVSNTRVDLVFTSSEYERGAIARARKVIIDGEAISYITPEDLVIVKIIAGRPRDIDDVRSVIDRQKLDLTHMRKWLKLFDDELGEDYEERLLSLLPKSQQVVRK